MKTALFFMEQGGLDGVGAAGVCLFSLTCTEEFGYGINKSL